MAHIVKYERLDQESTLSDEAVEVYNEYVVQGKILGVDTLVDEGSIFAVMRFATEADADAYLADMAVINENTNTGSKRGTLERYNEE